MFELSLSQILLAVFVGLFTVAAAVIDTRWRRIPNYLTLPMFVLGLIYQPVFHGWAALGDAALGFLVGFGTLFVLWLIGGGGGGDVKLMGALSVWLGFRMTLYVVIVSTICVMIGTLAVLFCSVLRYGARRTRTKFIATGKPAGPGGKPPKETVEDKKQRRIMTYALPVALATWLVIGWEFWKSAHL